MMRSWFLTVVALASGTVAATSETFTDKVRPVLGDYCVDCHGPDKQKADLNIAALDPDMVAGKDAETWQLILDQINLGEMPPKKKRQPETAERRLLVDWLTASLQAAAAKRKSPEVTLRRLTREQYSHTLRDLLKIQVDVGEALPEEAFSDDGFQNNGDSQVTSLLQTEYFLKLSRRAMALALPDAMPDKAYRYRVRFHEADKPEKRKKGGNKEYPLHPNEYTIATFPEAAGGLGIETRNIRKQDLGEIDMRGSHQHNRFTVAADHLVLQPALPHKELDQDETLAPPNPNVKLYLRRFPSSGSFVVRAKVAKLNPEEPQDPFVRAFIGARRDRGEDFRTIGSGIRVTGTMSTPQTVEFHGHLENYPVPVADHQDRLSIMTVGLWNDFLAADNNDRKPKLAVLALEFESPWLESWPPASQQEILNVAADATAESARSRAIIAQFMARAFRRPVTPSEIDRYHQLWRTVRPECHSFVESIRETLASVLCSPHFLYLAEPAAADQPTSETQLASRLSYFLWDSIPDDRLTALANDGRLRTALDQEVKRMLRDPKAQRFVEAFCRQWLKTYYFENVRVDRHKYPAFNRFVRSDMATETVAYFAEVLQQNLSIANFIDSDFQMLNQNLARYYNVAELEGSAFRRVAVQPGQRRGGLLTQGSFLVGHATGSEPHPIKRGVWLTSRLLDSPPPAPPPDVPALEVVRGDFDKMSIRELMEVHRKNPACYDCHLKIDPWGLAFQNYNAAGLRNGANKGDARVELPDGTEIDGVEQLKSYLLDEKDAVFTRAMVRQLLRYALGRSLSFTDEGRIDEIVASAEAHDGRLQDLITAIVQNPIFSQK